MATATHAAATQQTDPTRTTTVRRRFAQHVRARFDAVKWHVNTALFDKDVFGWSTPNRIVGDALAANVETDDELVPPTRAWATVGTAEATRRFDNWLDDVIDREVIEKYDGDTYVQHGYAKGVKNADTDLRQAGLADPDPDNLRAVIRRPVHRDELERIQERALRELEGVSSKTGQEMRRELADGFAEGKSPRDIGRSINDRVEKVGKTRGTLVARTEVIRAHSESSLTRYETISGDIQVGVKAEWLTAEDRKVCDECLAWAERGPYTIDEARGAIPRHPRCRCAWKPVQQT